MARVWEAAQLMSEDHPGYSPADTSWPWNRSAALGGKRYIRFTHDHERCYGTSDERWAVVNERIVSRSDILCFGARSQK